MTMEASEMSSMTETGTGDQAQNRDGDSRKQAILLVICCGIVLALLLAAAAASGMGGEEEEGKDEEGDIDATYVVGSKGGGGSPPKKDEITAAPENGDKDQKATTSITVKTEPPTQPTETTSMKSTGSTRKPKAFLGITCIQGLHGYPILNATKLFTLCQRLIAKLSGSDFGGKVDVFYGIIFHSREDPAYKKFADYIYWVWYYITIESYKKNYFERYPVLTYTHLHLHAFGISAMPLQKVFETNVLQQYLDTLNNIAPEKMALGIDFSDTNIDVSETMDATKFKGYGYVFVIRSEYATCDLDCLWYEKNYLDFAIALNNFLTQTVTIATTAGSAFMPYRKGAECPPWYLETTDLDENFCDSNEHFTGDFARGLFYCNPDSLYRTESIEGFKSLVNYWKSSNLNYGIDDIERLEGTINYTKWDLSFMNMGMKPPASQVN